jgi:ParB family transcriptional regulator, chromosome partitioning protein
LAASILDVGLLHPVMVTPRLELVAGERRLRAVQHLGRDTIPVTVVDLAEIARGELAENEERKAFTVSEAVSIKRAIEPLLKAEARERKVTGGKLKGAANLADASRGTARDLVARHTGKGHTSLAKAEAVVAAAEAEPGNVKLAKLVEAMDKSGRVDGPFRRLINMKQAEKRGAA